MNNSKYASLATINAAEKRIEKELRFTITCKNTMKVYEYDLSKKSYFSQHQEIVSVVAWAIYKRRNSLGHESRVSTIECLSNFFIFLGEKKLYEQKGLTRSILSQYVEWLKRYSGLSYSSAAGQYRTLSPLFRQMNRHPNISDDFIPVKNAFPKSETLKTTTTGYNKAELKEILNATIKSLRESAERLEKSYQPVWQGKPAPIEDVAPINPLTSTRSYWASHDYQVWWWENNCQFKRLNSSELFNLPKGQMLFNYTAPDNKGSIAHLNRFYDQIGAGPDYEPKYQGKPCPIKFKTPWKKPEYLLWYWENKMDCQPYSTKELKNNYPEFLIAIREHHGGRLSEFYKKNSVSRWLQGSDLLPYYLMLLIRTGMNPSTIQRLTIDCLTPDPFDGEKMIINWTKYRSFKKGKNIPSDARNDTWPVMIVKRVIEVTKKIRQPGQMELWITNLNRKKNTIAVGKTTFRKELNNFALKHQLKSNVNGDILALQAKEFRPTIAWQEYLRTEDMSYLKTLLGHTRLSTTSDYLRRINDPVFRSRRAIHQEAMFIGLTEHEAAKQEYLKNNIKESTKPSQVDNIIYHDGLMNHCKNPLHSPVTGEKEGEWCTVNNEVCLGCQNLVITPDDIKKYFCYINFYTHLLDVGDINQEEFDNATNEKKFIWQKYILPKYSKAVVDRLTIEAQHSPFPVWDIAVYERVEA
ncbi:MAG: hypothetical protein HON46_08475 [Gammaproteobacteria bacterium]|nr:hypothetical protein [Gammaproteobacteria bacterium]